jgi:DNA-binding HxlR family transcriptional regulator
MTEQQQLSAHRSLPQPLGNLERRCPVRTALDVIAGRWKPLILLSVKDGPRRYSDIERAVSGITAQVLSRHLGELTGDGVLERSSADGAVSYRLTDRGVGLSTIMDALEQWGTDYLAWRAQETSAKD